MRANTQGLQGSPCLSPAADHKGSDACGSHSELAFEYDHTAYFNSYGALMVVACSISSRCRLLKDFLKSSCRVDVIRMLQHTCPDSMTHALCSTSDPHSHLQWS